jgi:hypothetical protein
VRGDPAFFAPSALASPRSDPLLVSRVRAALHSSALGVSNRHFRVCECVAALDARSPDRARLGRHRPVAHAPSGARLADVGADRHLAGLVRRGPGGAALAAGPQCRAGARSRERLGDRYRCFREHGFARRGDGRCAALQIAACGGCARARSLGTACAHVRAAPVQLCRSTDAAVIARSGAAACTANAHRRCNRGDRAACRQSAAGRHRARDRRSRERWQLDGRTLGRARLVRRADPYGRRRT